MGLVKCPRCELNYMQEGDRYCAVCRREIRGEEEYVEVELCTACGERPAALGEDMCALCLREISRQEGAADAALEGAEHPLNPLAVTEIEEIELDDAQEDIPSGEMGEIHRELGDDEDEEEDLGDVDQDGIVTESLEQLEEEELNEADDDEDDL